MRRSYIAYPDKYLSGLDGWDMNEIERAMAINKVRERVDNVVEIEDFTLRRLKSSAVSPVSLQIFYTTKNANILRWHCCCLLERRHYSFNSCIGALLSHKHLLLLIVATAEPALLSFSASGRAAHRYKISAVQYTHTT